MGFIDFPNPADWFESAKNSGMERDVANTVLSGVYSFWIAGMWSLGQRKYLSFVADAATAMYLSLSDLQKKGLLALTVPKAMLAANNLSKFETILITK